MIGSPYVLAFDFGGSKTAVALFNPDGTIAAEMYLANSIDGSAQDANSILAAATVAGKSLLVSHEIRNEHQVLVGAVSPGIILSNRILLAPNVAGWDGVALAQRIQNSLEVPVVRVANDVKAAAAAEALWGNLHDHDPGLYVNLGTGIAVASVVNAKVVHGAHGWAGEVGYNTVAETHSHVKFSAPALLNETDEAMVDGDSCAHTLETLVGAGALRRLAQLAGLGHLETALLIGSISTDPVACKLVTEAMNLLGEHLAAMVHLLDPERIVVGGGLAGASKTLIPLLSNALHQSLGFAISEEFGAGPFGAVEVVSSAFATRASLYGARLVALGMFP
jgi:glucokinase